MNTGRITFDHRLSLDVSSVVLLNGRIEIRAFGKVTKRPPTGVIPLALYGSDDRLIAVTRADWDQLLVPARVRKGDFLDLTLRLDVEYMKGLT